MNKARKCHDVNNQTTHHHVSHIHRCLLSVFECTPRLPTPRQADKRSHTDTHEYRPRQIVSRAANPKDWVAFCASLKEKIYNKTATQSQGQRKLADVRLLQYALGCFFPMPPAEGAVKNICISASPYYYCCTTHIVRVFLDRLDHGDVGQDAISLLRSKLLVDPLTLEHFADAAVRGHAEKTQQQQRKEGTKITRDATGEQRWGWL